MTADGVYSILPFLSWMPPWLLAAGIFAAIAVAASILQSAVIAFVARLTIHAHPTLRQIFVRTKRTVRFGIVLLATAIALPVVPMAHDVQDDIRKVFAAAVVVLIGWVVLIATNIAADHYVGGFQLDAEDNLLARKAVTQARVLKRSLNVLILVVTAGFALMMFDSVREYGVSLFASAGAAGIIVGLASRPVLSNLFAGMQIAMTQPMRLDDVVVVEGNWGRIEEITSTYVVVKIWDLRRLIVPLTYFLENPFENWTRASANILGTIFLYTDYTVPVAQLREKLLELVKANPKWDGQTVALQVTDAKENTIEIRALVSARNSGLAWDLRCEIREQLIAYIQEEFPGALPRRRAELTVAAPAATAEQSGDARPDQDA